jgi:p-hydroxybenzoate 3-monooxygenase
MRQQGQRHTGFSIAINDEVRRVDLEKFADGASVLVYGQTEIQRDLFEE